MHGRLHKTGQRQSRRGVLVEKHHGKGKGRQQITGYFSVSFHGLYTHRFLSILIIHMPSTWCAFRTTPIYCNPVSRKYRCAPA